MKLVQDKGLDIRTTYIINLQTFLRGWGVQKALFCEFKVDVVYTYSIDVCTNSKRNLSHSYSQWIH